MHELIEYFDTQYVVIHTYNAIYSTQHCTTTGKKMTE